MRAALKSLRSHVANGDRQAALDLLDALIAYPSQSSDVMEPVSARPNQGTPLTNAERCKRYRERHGAVSKSVVSRHGKVSESVGKSVANVSPVILNSESESDQNSELTEKKEASEEQGSLTLSFLDPKASLIRSERARATRDTRHDTTRVATRKATRRHVSKVSEPTEASVVWDAYSRSFADRYGTAPLANAKSRSILKRYRELVPSAEWVSTIEHYLRSNEYAYTNGLHPLELLLRDANKLAALARTGRHSTAHGARRVDKQSDRMEQYEEMFAELREEDRREAAGMPSPDPLAALLGIGRPGS